MMLVSEPVIWVFAIVQVILVGTVAVLGIKQRNLLRRYEQFRLDTADTFALAFARMMDLNSRLTMAGHPPGQIAGLTPYTPPTSLWTDQPGNIR